MCAGGAFGTIWGMKTLCMLAVCGGLSLWAMAAFAAPQVAQSSNSIALDTTAYNIAVGVSEDGVEPLLTTTPGFVIIVM